MVRKLLLAPALTALFCLGCGKSEVTQTSNPAPQSAAAGVAAATAAGVPTPTDIVSQFLDLVRRGGEDSGAETLLTEAARSELKRIGRTIQPMGSPDAKYQVTRFEKVPGQENSALVHSIWSDPDGSGGQSDYQVVWAVVREPVGWRISGMAIAENESAQPIIIDFENGELMAQVLGANEPASQATAPAATSVR